jgi:hypothetical protein
MSDHPRRKSLVSLAIVIGVGLTAGAAVLAAPRTGFA